MTPYFLGLALVGKPFEFSINMKILGVKLGKEWEEVEEESDGIKRTLIHFIYKYDV